MPAPVIRIELQADGPLVAAPSYRDAIDALLGLLRELDRAFTQQAGGAGQSTRWFIQRTATSDPTIDLLAEPSTSDIDVVDRTITEALDSLGILQNSPSHPPFLTHAGLEHCQALGRLIQSDGLAQMVVSNNGRKVTLTESLQIHVTELLGRREEVLGSVEGELEMVTLRGRRYFNVYNLATGRATRCYFDAYLIPTVKETLGKVVIVAGLIRSLPHEENQEMTNISKLEVVEFEDLPTPSDIRGIMPNLTEGKPSERYLKERWGGR